jgi:serine/threonine protein phosphatase PrpC
MESQKVNRQRLISWCTGAAAVAAAVFALNFLRKRITRPRNVSKPPVRLQFSVVSGGAAGAVYQFVGSQVATVGRRDSNSVCLLDTGVSGQHFQAWFNKEEEAWQLVDLGSTNGTTLNRFQIVAHQGVSEPHTLCSGDRIQVGEGTILIVTCDPSGSSPTSSQTVGDLTALELIKRLKSCPLPASTLSSISLLDLPSLRATVCSIQKQASKSRNKTTCEDTFSLFSPIPGIPLMGLCVADGHCGDETSSAIQRILPGILVEHLGTGCTQALASASESLQLALVDTFAAIDAQVEGQDGSTMTLLLLRGDDQGSVHIQAANVGDSAVVCADFTRMVKYHLTDNHRVSQPGELARLRETKSLLTHNETRLMGLNLSRSIGDKALKDLNPGFVAEPYVSKVHTVTAGEDLLIILASDGLWDVTNANLVMRVAYRVLSDYPGDIKLLCEVLMEHAVSRRSKDDITIVVLQICGRNDSPSAQEVS